MSDRLPRVELHIDELVVDGVEAFDSERFGTIVGQQFARLLAEHGLPAGLTRNLTSDRIESAPVELTRSTELDLLAIQLATALYAGLDR